ncbi:MAG: recombinase family protein [Hyphomicrobiales bacterium]
MKLAAYLRISQDREGNSDAPDRQEADIRAWAARHGHEITAVFTDRDLSAFNRQVKRPGFEAMVAEKEKTPWW